MSMLQLKALIYKLGSQHSRLSAIVFQLLLLALPLGILVVVYYLKRCCVVCANHTHSININDVEGMR